MDWLIIRYPMDANALEDAKKKLIDEYVDLDTLKTMTYEDSQHWRIKWGLCKRLIKNIKRYIHEEDFDA